MKIRTGFISNSSSSSFVISLDDISGRQLKMIENHIEIAKGLRGFDTDGDEQWHIYTDEYFVYGRTFMDNFDMDCFLTSVVRVPEDKIKWE